MGRNKADISKFFIEKSFPDGSCFYVCKQCIAAYEMDPENVPEPKLHQKRVERMLTHLKNCVFQKTMSNSVERIPQSKNYVQKTLDFAKPHSAKRKQHIEQLYLEFIAENDLPFRLSESFSAKRFFSCLDPASNSSVPDRKCLVEKLLPSYSNTVLTEFKDRLLKQQEIGNGVATLLCDDWKNIKSTHLLAIQLNHEGERITVSAAKAGDRHDGIWIAKHIENAIAELITQNIKIGCVVTDDAGSCSRARRILALRWPKIVFLKCFAHQIHLIVKNLLKDKILHETFKEAADFTNTLNNSTCVWLPRMQEICRQLYGTSLALLRPIETRWNSSQAMFASLLRVKEGLQSFVLLNQNKQGFPSKLKCATNPDFWLNVAHAEKLIRPLCIASFRFQNCNASLSDVFFTIGCIYSGFLRLKNSEYVENLNIRWLTFEQPLYVLAFYLNPKYFKQSTKIIQNANLNSIFSCKGQICEIAAFYFLKLLGKQSTTIRRDMFEWITTGPSKVTTATLEEFNSDLVLYFAYLQTVCPDRKFNDLSQLAGHLHSLQTQTASIEQMFSQWGNIHTKKRNCLDPSNVVKLQIVKDEVKRKQKAQGHHQKHRKQYFIDPTEKGSCQPEESCSLSLIEQLTAPSSQSNYDALSTWVENFAGIDEFCDDGVEYFSHQSLNEPIPDYNDINFPQETTLTGVRATKVHLQNIFYSDFDVTE